MRLAGDFKNNDLQPIRFDRGGVRPYYTRPMAASPQDPVDCRRLAESAARLERVFELRDLPRLQSMLASARGCLRASFAFAMTETGRPGVTVAIESTPMLQCQRCLEPFEWAVRAESEIEFAADEKSAASVSDREPFVLSEGAASLRDLAEEELLLALPVAPACDEPRICGRAPSPLGVPGSGFGKQETVRPFSALQDLLKKP